MPIKDTTAPIPKATFKITLAPVNNISVVAKKTVSPAGNIKTTAGQSVKPTLLQSIIIFPNLSNSHFVSLELDPGAYSNNTETPIYYTTSNPAIATIAPDGLLLIASPGTCQITAHQDGDSNYAAASPVTAILTITAYQNIIFPSITPQYTCYADFPTAAYEQPSSLPLSSLPFIYASSNTAVATITQQGLVHIVGAGTSTITIDQPGNTLYYAAPEQSQILTVNAPPIPTVTIIPGLKSVCANLPVTFTATVGNVVGTISNLTYQWQVNGVNAGTNSAGFTTALLSSTDVVKCTVTNNTVCQVTGFNSYSGIIVNPYLTPSVSVKSSVTTPVCPGISITFTAIAVNGGSNPIYQWQVNGVNAGTNSNQLTGNTFAYTDLVTCSISSNDSPCLTAQTATSLPVAPNIVPPAYPSVSISASAISAYPGVPIVFTATPANAVVGMLTYQWQVNGNNAGANSPVFTSGTLHNGDEVTCVLLMSSGCIPSVISNEIAVTIIPAPVVTVINTFTPNNDGVNDRWDIPALITYPNCLVLIFNRYGSLIYQSKGYNIAWDGTYNGSPVPASTYYYVIDLGNKKPKLSGSVTV